MLQLDNDSKLLIPKLPKVELHAHLSGSLSDETTSKLLKERKNKQKNEQNDMEYTLTLGNQRTLEECFDVFKVIHMLMDNIESVKMITSDVVKEFNEDNVRYLEIRTTPKSIVDAYSKRQYLEAVLQTVMNAESSLEIVVRVVISIDRGRGVSDAWDTLNLAKDYSRHEQYGKYVCGIDVSGNPKVGSLKEYIPILKEAKKMGLKTAVHLLEVNTEVAFDEAFQVIEEGLVDRIGHATFLHPLSGGSEALTNSVKNKCIPIVSSLEEHHAKIWNNENHPISICTDDKGVFSTTSSKELLLFNQLMRGEINVENIILASLESSFLDDNEKHRLKESMKSEISKLIA